MVIVRVLSYADATNRTMLFFLTIVRKLNPDMPYNVALGGGRKAGQMQGRRGLLWRGQEGKGGE